MNKRLNASRVSSGGISPGEKLFLQMLHPNASTNFQPDEAVLSNVKSTALKHNLLPLVYTQLRKHQKEFSNNNPIVNFMKELRPLFLQKAAISMRQESIEKEIISLLQERDIDAIVIKGNTIAKEIYHEPSCRFSTDIDILVRSSDAFQIDSLLSEAGYIRDQQLPLGYCIYRLHHVAYKHPRKDTVIEIHWIFGIPFLYNLSSEEIWAEMHQSGAAKETMPSVMTLVQLLINHHMHSFRKLKTTVDILWTLHRYDNKIDWIRFAAQLKKIGLIKTAFISLHQIQSLWRDGVTDMGSFKALYREITGIGVKQPRRLMAYFRLDLKENYASTIFKDKVIARFALDQWSAVILSYVKTIVPSPQAIKGFYKDRRNWILPWNYSRFTLFLIMKWIRSDPRNW